MTQTTQLERLPGTAVSTSPIPRKSRTPSRFLTAIDGQRLRCLRRQHGLSQEALADQAGISLTTLARLERQRRSPCRTWTLGAFAVALGERPADMKFAGTGAN
jgi:DNA-binding XRE family transcriptional regulator